MKNQANRLFEEAIEKLNEADAELFRPEEDVVSFLVCKNSQHAIENYLKGFLLQNEVDPSEFKTIDDLYERCKLIDKTFEEIELFDLKCRSHAIDSKYSNTTPWVSKCFDTAARLDAFFRRTKIID